MRTLITPPVITGRVSAAGVPMAGADFYVQRISTGNYTIRFTKPGFKLMSINAISNMQQWTFVLADSFTENSCRVQFCNTAGAALIDTQFAFTAFGM